MHRSMFLFALGILLCATPASAKGLLSSEIKLARGPSAAKLVDRGVQFYYEGRYQKAQKLLKQALNSGRLNKTRRTGAMQYLAFCQVALGKNNRARDTFNDILDAHPAFRLPAGTAPKILQLFEVVKAARPTPELPPDIHHAQPSSGRPDSPTRIEASVENMPQGGALFAHYRHNEASPFSRLEMRPTPEGHYRAIIPAAPAGKSQELSYYLSLNDAQGQAKGALGSSAEPLRVPMKNEVVGGDKPKIKKEESSTWWIWAVVGTVVVGAAAGVAIALTLPGNDEPTGRASFTFILEE
ncbi:MAG: tetratricopeptide repeat protein [Deltaproteobacteria bacterium]|nr:tetratricopeptide repeat protein [Deltaproteobacteria bacterium]